MAATTLQQTEALPAAYPVLPENALVSRNRAVTTSAAPDQTLTWPRKDPDEVLDYHIDWSPQLSPSDTILTSTFTLVAAAGLTINSQTYDPWKSWVWLSGGTADAVATVRCVITTPAGRTYEQDVILPIRGTSAAAFVWQRLESYVAWRWTPRTVVWIVEGPGAWSPPLAPAVISTIEVWSSADEWETATLSPSPLGGYYLPHTGPWRFTATVGAGVEPPAAVVEAFRRLAVYWDDAGRENISGARSQTEKIGDLVEEWSRSPVWIARAMSDSGAADLLRSYRRV